MRGDPYTLHRMAEDPSIDQERALDTFRVWIPHVAEAALGMGPREAAKMLIDRGWHFGDPDLWPRAATDRTSDLMRLALDDIRTVAERYTNAQVDLLRGGTPDVLESVSWARVGGPVCADPAHPYGEDHYKYLSLEDGTRFYIFHGGHVRMGKYLQNMAGMVTTLNNKVEAAYDMYDSDDRPDVAQLVTSEIQKASNITGALMRYAKRVGGRCRRLLEAPDIIDAWVGGTVAGCDATHRYVHG